LAAVALRCSVCVSSGKRRTISAICDGLRSRTPVMGCDGHILLECVCRGCHVREQGCCVTGRSVVLLVVLSDREVGERVFGRLVRCAESGRVCRENRQSGPECWRSGFGLVWKAVTRPSNGGSEVVRGRQSPLCSAGHPVADAGGVALFVELGKCHAYGN
jgi:hypothetical protein